MIYILHQPLFPSESMFDNIHCSTLSIMPQKSRAPQCTFYRSDRLKHDPISSIENSVFHNLVFQNATAALDCPCRGDIFLPAGDQNTMHSTCPAFEQGKREHLLCIALLALAGAHTIADMPAGLEQKIIQPMAHVDKADQAVVGQADGQIIGGGYEAPSNRFSPAVIPHGLEPSLERGGLVKPCTAVQGIPCF